jgi:dolichol-phosphate mannosyltransferase
VVSVAAAGYLVFVLAARLFTDYAIPGWSSILATVLVLGGTQLTVLRILGEYVGRLYEEAKQRPIYILRATNRRPPGVRSLPSDLIARGEPRVHDTALTDVHQD